MSWWIFLAMSVTMAALLWTQGVVVYRFKASWVLARMIPLFVVIAICTVTLALLDR